MPDLSVLVMVPGESLQEQGNARGHLFERFVAKLLSRYGFEEPHISNLKVTSEGIELDVVTKHKITHAKAMRRLCRRARDDVTASDDKPFNRPCERDATYMSSVGPLLLPIDHVGD
jgi:hypothetical protein